MNELIARVTSPGFRKYCYRVAWAAALVLVASGKLDAGQLEVALGLVAAVLAVADSQTTPNVTAEDKVWADGVVSGLRMAETNIGPEDKPEWQPPVETAGSDAWSSEG